MTTVSEYLNILVGFDVPKLKAEAGKVNKELSDVDKKANNLMKSFGNAKKMALGFFAALAGTSSIAAFVANVTAADAALGRLSKTTGMSVEAISAWSNAAERAGGSAAEMQSGIANMSKELTNFKYTGESTLVPFLAQMGVSIVDVNGKLKDQNQIMLELADRAQNMPKEDFANLAMANGFNQSQVNLMLQGRKALQQQINEQNRNAITTKQQAEAAQQLETAWVDAKQAFMGVARTIAYVLVPPLTLLLKGVAAIFTFIGNHKIILVALFAFLVPKLLMTVKLFLTLGRAIGLLSPALRVATLAMRGFGLSTAIALAPLILIGTALALLFDDFMTFQAGGDSFIPWDKIFGGAKTAIQDIKDLIFSVGTLMDLLKAVGQGDWKAAASLGKKLIMDATPVGIAAKVADRVVTGGKNVDAVNKDAVAATKEVKAEKVIVATTSETAEYKTNKTNSPNTNTVPASTVIFGKKNYSNTLNLTEQDIIDIMKVASTEVVGSLKGKAFEDQAAGVVDTILNRAASGKYGNGVRGVANQRWAFSDINAPRKSAYGSVQNVPMSRVSPRMREFVRRYLAERAAGRESSVGQNVNYANPYFLAEAKASTKRWVHEVEAQAARTGQRFGSGKAVHVHGTPSADRGKMPKPFNISLNGSISSVPYMGAKGQAALKASNGANVNSVHSETHIGNININTMATDAAGVAKAIPHEIKNQYSKLAHAVSSGMS